MSTQSQQADIAISVVRDAFLTGLRSMGLSDGEAFAVYQAGPSSTVSGGFWWSYEQTATLTSLKNMSPLIGRWRDVKRAWAEKGSRDDGSAYSWEAWFSEGRGYANDIAFQANVHVDSGAFVAIKETVSETARTVAGGAQDIASGVGDVAQVLGKNLHVIVLGLGLVAVGYLGLRLTR